MKEITIPKKLAPLIKAFSADDQSAKLLIIEAAKTICEAEKGDPYSLSKKEISNEELEGIFALIRGLAPRDTLEMIYGAQIVVSHLAGLRFLCHNNSSSDQVLGLKLLKFSNEAMNQLQRKRSGGINQNINVHYHDHKAIPKDEPCQLKEVGCAELDAEQKEAPLAFSQQ